MNFISTKAQINKLKSVMKRAAITSGKHLIKAYRRKKLILQKNQKKNGLPKLIWQLRKS